ncbi:MAG: S41 family peptidase [Chloroflexi bacterium]|nr:S41 family peptidase [Chloroflexota bacterium]
MRRFSTHTRLFTFGVMLALALAVLVTGYVLNSRSSDELVQAQGDQPPAVQELFRPFWETWNLLHDNYVDPLDDNTLMKAALVGMVEASEDPDPAAIYDEVLPEGEIEATDDEDIETVDIEELFDPFWAAWDLLHAEYGGDLDDTTLMEGAIIGMLSSLGDPHTDYMDPDTYAHILEAMSGAYEGIGATVRKDENTGGLELVSIIEVSPAEAAGLRPGDQIVEVAGDDVTGLTQSEIVALVRGPAGTPVLLGILRPGEPEILEFEVIRDEITAPSVYSEMLDGDIAYIRLVQFDLDTGVLLRNVIEELDVNNRSGLILDVRADPGGYLTTSIEVASVFIEEGPVVIERGPGREHTYQALGNAIAPDVPMVVLVDEGSASASELVAGALQDLDRAVVVGMPTFGKGSVQTWRELSNGGGVRITISRWYTPNGTSVSEVGITPDIIVPFEIESPEDDDPQIQAAIEVLQGELEPVAAE